MRIIFTYQYLPSKFNVALERFLRLNLQVNISVSLPLFYSDSRRRLQISLMVPFESLNSFSVLGQCTIFWLFMFCFTLSEPSEIYDSDVLLSRF